MDKNTVDIKKFYDELANGEKGRFLTWIQVGLEVSLTTAKSRIINDRWRAIEREFVENGIRSRAWESLTINN